MSYIFQRLVCITLLLPLVSLPVPAEDWQYQTDGRVIAMSDIHGAFDAFLELVSGLELVDEQGHWSGGEDHLVIVGDVLDRGAASRDVLEMLLRLEDEAAKAGGRVHMLLGNHEVMNLVGDLRYVAVDEFGRYAELESGEARSAALETYMRLREGADLDRAALEAAFAKQHPPGFFAHQALLASEGKLGSWLLKRPVVIRVNDSVFVHGGLSSAVAGMSLAEINRLHSAAINDYMQAREYLVAKQWLEAGTNFYDQPSTVRTILAARPADAPLSAEEESRVRQLFTAYNSEIFDSASPTWYRGNVGCSPAIENSRLKDILADLGARRLVIGHTPTATRTVESRFDEMLVRVDTGMLHSHYRGRPSAVMISQDKLETFYPDNPANTTTVTPRRVGPRPAGLSDSELETVYETAPVVATTELKRGTKRVQLEHEGAVFDALYMEAESKKKGKMVIPAVAAYRLDSYLELELVPATAVREIEGEPGSLGLDPGAMIDEKQRIARRLGSAWCPLQDQFNMMYLFDLLAYNRGRQEESMRYSGSAMNLVLTDNTTLFGTRGKAPRYLGSVDITVPEGVREKLEKLDDLSLEKMLGDVLDERRRKAILSRRDQLFKQAK